MAQPATFMPDVARPFQILYLAHFALNLIVVANSDKRTKQRRTPHCRAFAGSNSLKLSPQHHSSAMLRPQRIDSAAVRAWSSRWSLSALAREPLGLTAKRSASPDFMYVAAARRDSLLPDTSAAHEEEVNLTAAELVAAVQSAGPPHHYFTSPLDSLGRLESLGPVDGWEELLPQAPSGRRPWLQLWASSAGSFTQAHYDVADNCFVQCDGRKHFLVWPPSSAEALRVFPDAHPRARKAQIEVEAALAAAAAQSDDEV